jgi:aryl-alcohol dehydrogenase-like predicted oxidoreductase
VASLALWLVAWFVTVAAGRVIVEIPVQASNALHDSSASGHFQAGKRAAYVCNAWLCACQRNYRFAFILFARFLPYSLSQPVRSIPELSMQYRKFGRTGLTVSRLCLGTMTFGLQTEEDASRRILDTAADAGVNFIDTADVYPLGSEHSDAGRTEEIVGRWLKGKRDRFILATKAVGKMGPSAWDQGASRKHLLDAIDASLKRLGTDYVDLYQLHTDDADTPLDETLEALDVIVRSGKARYIGVSNFLAYRLARALGRADVLRAARFVSVQPRYNLLFRQIERELLPLAAEEQLAVMPYNPLAGGLLTGKHKLDAAPPSGRFTETVGKAGAMYQERYWHQREFETIERLKAIVEPTGESLTRMSLAWVLANPLVTSAIIGASRAEQLNDTLAASELVLDADIKQQLDEASVEYRWGDAAR